MTGLRLFEDVSRYLCLHTITTIDITISSAIVEKPTKGNKNMYPLIYTYRKLKIFYFNDKENNLLFIKKVQG